MPVQIPGLENLSPAVKYVIAFAIIFVLLALFALVLRRLTSGRSAITSERGRARQPRLGIVDVYDLDRQRQLILLRRDNVEHLLLVGGPNDVVVETNIVRVPGARLTPAALDVNEPATESMRPVVDALARPSEPTIAARLGPSETASAGPNGIGPSPVSVREPILKPTTVSAAPAPAPELPARPPVQPPPRPPVGPDRGPAPETIRVGESATRRPAPPPRPEPVRPPPPPPPPPAAEVRVRAPEPAPRAPEPRPAEPTVRVSETAVRVTEPAVRVSEPRPARPASPPPEAAEPAPVRPAPRPAPPPPTPPPPPPPAPAPPPTPAPAPAPAATKSDPFSIEDIEAEFARLLGRPLDKKE